jgi:hypothetical protein
MTPRPLVRTRRAAALLSAALLLGLVGCDPRQALFFLQPFDPTVAAPCPSLKGKRVVILTTAVPGTQNDFVTLDRDLTRELVPILREKIKKIDIVDTDKVFAWAQAHPSSTNPADAARAFEADVVIFLEIQQFEVTNINSPELLNGKSNIHIQVTELDYPKDSRGRAMKDKPKEEKEIYSGDRDTVFPKTGAIPVSADVSRATFKGRFLKLVANEVSWHFVEHAPGDDIQDTKFNQ